MYLTLLMLGDLARAQQRHDQAVAYYDESMGLIRTVGDAAHTAHALLGIACAREAQGRLAEAAPLIRESLELLHTLGDRRVIAACLDALARLALDQGEAERAARLLGAAAGLRESIGAAPAHALFAAPPYPNQFKAAWSEGLSLGYDEAVATALAAENPGAPSASSSAPWPASLTPREREIAVLLTERLTNREIAGRLVISEQTVETHVKRVLSKLELPSRTQVAAWAHRATSGAPGTSNRR
jgi:non-specific serine/threonine protein kinase